MDAQKVDMFLMTNSKFIESHHVPMLREQLIKADDDKLIYLQSVDLKDPTIALVVSLFGGQLGIDRFLIGDTGMGIGKLLTCGGFGFWAIIDWFMIMGATREKNMEKLQMALA